MTGSRVVLLTGGSGVVGSALLPYLVEAADTEIVLLLRAGSADALATRRRACLDFAAGRMRRDHEARVAAVRGDVAETSLGLAPADHASLVERVTHIVHAAGVVKLNQPLDAARRSAIDGVAHGLEFARACAAHRPPPKMEYLSTVGVAGRRSGVVPEAPLDDVAGYHNTYEQAKAEAEAMALAASREGLPITVHRPSMVVGDSRDGRVIHFQVFYHLARFIAGARTRGIVPAFGDVRLDLVPSDYVARAIATSMTRADATGRILHLCAGPGGAMPLDEVGERVRAFLAAHGEAIGPPRHVPRSMVRLFARVGGAVVPGSAGRALASLPHFLDYLAEDQRFANAQTAAFFARENLRPPPIASYLDTVLEYWHARRAPAHA
jgi:thioester reductase-like protein